MNQVTLSTSLNAMEIASAWQMALVILGSPPLGFDGRLITVMCLKLKWEFLEVYCHDIKKQETLQGTTVVQFIAFAEGSWLPVCLIGLIDDCNL